MDTATAPAPVAFTVEMMMNVTRTLAALATACLLAAAPVWAADAPVLAKRGIEHQRMADLGNGSYLNPVLAGDHPDPSVLKDGDDYYLTLSSFDAYPGLPIWHSRDLVNWQPLGHAITTNVGAIWAPDIIKHKGRYFIYFPARTAEARSNFVGLGRRHQGPVERAHRHGPGRLHRPRPCRGRGRQALPVPVRWRLRADQRRRPERGGHAQACL